MTSQSESNISEKGTQSGKPSPGWLKLGAVAFASAVLGGVATAWWYQKTVKKLHETEENTENPQFGIDPAPSFEESDEGI